MKNPAMKIEKKYFTESLPIRRMILSESADYKAEQHEITDAEKQMIRGLVQKVHNEYDGRILHKGRYEVFQMLSKFALEFAEDCELDVKVEIDNKLEGSICLTGNMISVQHDNEPDYRSLFCQMIVTAREFYVCPSEIDGEPVSSMCFLFDLYKPLG